MGWGYCGEDRRGRQIGYGIQATCDTRGCNEVINRGLGYCCGPMHGGDDGGCGRYLCANHLSWVGPRGGCAHRGTRAWGKTFCQLLGHNGYAPDHHIPKIYFSGFSCACGTWKSDATGLTLDEWRKVPGYLDHIATSTLVTDMIDSGEEAFRA